MARMLELPRQARDWWWRVVWSIVVVAVVTGAFGWAYGGDVRRVMLAAQILAALGLAALVSSGRLGRSGADFLLRGGYRPPRSRGASILHLVVALLYNAGIVVAVAAATIRFGVIDVSYRTEALRWFPLVTGLLLMMSAVATGWRLDEEGGVLRSWYTRAHGWLLVALAVPMVAAATWLVAAGEAFVGSTPILTDADLLVLALLAVLGATTQVYLAVNLPSGFELAALGARVFRRGPARQESGTPPIFYAAMITLIGLVLIGSLLHRVEVVDRLDFRNDRVALLLLLIPLGLALFFLSSVLQALRESRRGVYTRKMSSRLRTSLLIYGFGTLFGMLFGILLVLNMLERLPTVPYLPSGRDLSKDLIAATIVAGLGPIGFHVARERRRVHNIEGRLPDFLNDLAETRRAGLTMVAALRSTALSDYGALTPEIKKMADQVAWGVSFTEAVQQFADRVPTMLVRRTMYLIVEASSAGGSVAQILKAAAHDAYEIKALEADRNVTMMTYLIVLYVVFGVFMVVIGVLDTRFIPQVVMANEAATQAGTPALGQGGLDENVLNFVYYNAAIVQAVGNGLVAGVLTEGRITAGFRHVTYMTVLAWAVFRVLL